MKLIVILLGVLFSNIHTLDAPATGDKAPLFEAKDDKGDLWNLEDQLGEKYIVMYFYPAAMTGGCTKQACSYRDMRSDLQNIDAMVVGISGDEVENLKIFKDAHNLNFPLLSDPDGSIAEKYGVPLRDGGSIERTVGGQTFTLNRGVTSARWTFVIDRSGKIIYKNTQVNAEQDSQQVIDAIKSNKGE